MPLYSYKCSECGEMKDEYNSIALRHVETPVCGCGGKTKLSIQPTQIAPVMGGGDFPGYRCPVTDEFITSRRKRKYIMDEHNLVEVGDKSPSKKRVQRTEDNKNGIAREAPKEAVWELADV